MEMTDVLIHVHPDLPPAARAKVEQDIQACKGVLSAHFNHQEHPHAVVVEYDPDAIQAREILETVKRSDPQATMIGL